MLEKSTRSVVAWMSVVWATSLSMYNLAVAGHNWAVHKQKTGGLKLGEEVRYIIITLSVQCSTINFGTTC